MSCSRSRNIRWLILPLATIALAGALAAFSGCHRGAKTDETATTAATAATPVEAQPVTIGTVTHWVSVSGSLAALNDVAVSSRLNGRLARVLVREGDNVAAGQVVAELDMADQRSQLQIAEGAVQAAMARLEQAKAAYRQQLVASQSAVKAATAAYEQQKVSTKAGIDSARAALASAKAMLSQVREGARSQEIRRAQEQVTIAKAQYDKAQADTRRYRTLTSQGAAAKATLEQFETAEAVAQAQLRAAEEALSLTKEGARSQEVTQAEQVVRQAEEGVRQAEAAKAMDEVRAADVATAKAGLAQIDVRAADVQAARAALHQAQNSAAVARKALTDAFIRSPLSGQVASRTAEPGQVVAAGSPILRIVALNSIGFEPAVPARELGLIKVGQPVEITISKLSDQPFRGRVAVIYPAGSEKSRSFTLRITIDNASGLLRPEMFAQGRIQVESHPGAMLVPTESVLRLDSAPDDATRGRVFVVEGGAAVEYPVQVGLKSDDGLLVEVRGLPQSAQVVTEGQNGLKGGDRVTVGTGVK